MIDKKKSVSNRNLMNPLIIFSPKKKKKKKKKKESYYYQMCDINGGNTMSKL